MNNRKLCEAACRLRYGAGMLWLKLRNTGTRFFKKRVFENRDGMGTIEVIMIIAVLVALALIFRNFIGEVSAKIFNKIREKTDTAVESL